MRDTDRNFHSVADVDGRTLEDLRFDPEDEGSRAEDFDDILKFSHARNITALRLYVAGGGENAIDMNRECAGIRIRDSLLRSGDQCAVVIKGGSNDIMLSRVRLDADDDHTAYDIELGGWSDQSMKRTRRVCLHEVSRLDGRPVRVVVGWADRPAVLGGRCRILFWRSVGLKAFWLARYVARKFQRRTER
jgi:hypothetical protein